MIALAIFMIACLLVGGYSIAYGVILLVQTPHRFVRAILLLLYGFGMLACDLILVYGLWKYPS